jgi:hypothetical protein
VAVAQEMLRDPIIIGFLLSGPFILLMMVGVLLNEDSPASGSRKYRIGSLFLDLGAVFKNLPKHGKLDLTDPVSF